MKNFVAGMMAVSMTLVSTAGLAQQVESQSQTLIEITAQLSSQKAELQQLQTELKKAKTARTTAVTLTIASAAVSVLTALPGIVSTYGGINNVSKGVPWLGDPDNGGALMIPVIVVATAASAGTGYGAYRGYQKIQMRTADIEKLTAKVDAKIADIEKAEQLIKTIK